MTRGAVKEFANSSNFMNDKFQEEERKRILFIHSLKELKKWNLLLCCANVKNLTRAEN